jgi:hypothetical protein
MRVVAVIFMSSLIATNALADAPLAPGKPAGVRKAMSRTGELYWLGLGTVAAIGLGIFITKGNSTTAATGTGSP